MPRAIFTDRQSPCLKPIRDWLWGAAALVFAPVTVFAANGMVIPLGLLALAAPGVSALRNTLSGLARTGVGWSLGGLLGLAALSLFWTPAPGDAADKLLRLAILWLGGVSALSAVNTADRTRIKWFARLLPAAVCLALLFYWIELASSARLITLLTGLREVMQARYGTPEEQEYFRALYGFGAISRGAVLLTIFVWPAMACCAALFSGWGKWLAPTLGGAVFTTVFFLPMQAAPLAMGAGAVAFLLAWCAPRRGPRLLAALMIVLIGVVPLSAYQIARPEALGVAKSALPGSWQHRVEIWHYSAGKIAHKPVLGWGFDASRGIERGQTQFVLETPDGGRRTFPGVSLLPLHPHNGVLQIWLELGAIGALLAALFVFGLGRRLVDFTAGHGRFAGAAAAACASSALTIALLSFGLWQSWWQASLWLAAVLCLGAGRSLAARL